MSRYLSIVAYFAVGLGVGMVGAFTPVTWLSWALVMSCGLWGCLAWYVVETRR